MRRTKPGKRELYIYYKKTVEVQLNPRGNHPVVGVLSGNAGARAEGARG